MTIDRMGHYIECHVVPDTNMQEEMILGMDFVKSVDIWIRAGRVTVKRVTKDEQDDSNEEEGAAGLSWYSEVERSNI